MEHTPTPWYSRQTGFGIVHILPGADDSTALGSTYSMDDAAFIVRAVNTYEKDQERKEEILQTLKYLHDAIYSSQEPWLVEAARVAKLVIDRAEEK